MKEELLKGDYEYSSGKRIKWIDMLKGIANIAVIMGHIVGETYIGDFIYTFSVPLFIFVSGYLFKSYNSFKEYFVHRFKSLIIPYIIFGLPFPIVMGYYNSAYRDGVFNFFVSPTDFAREFASEFIRYILQIRYNVLWYLAFIFIVSIVMYFILKISRRWIQIAIILALLTVGSVYVSMGGKPLVWNIDTVPMSLPFYYVGHLLAVNGKCVSKIRDMDRWKAAVIFIAFTIGDIVFNWLTLYVSGQKLRMFYNEYGFVPFTYISAFCGIFAMMILAIRTQPRIVVYIGRHSLIFYLMHQGLIFLFNNNIYPALKIPAIFEVIGTGNYNLADYPLIIGLLVIYFIPVCLIIWLVIKLLSHTPLRKYV